MKESPGTSTNTRSKLWSCVMEKAPPSTWQYENLEGVIKYGTTIRRQPTKTEFKNIKKLLFTSRKSTGLSGAHAFVHKILERFCCRELSFIQFISNGGIGFSPQTSQTSYVFPSFQNQQKPIFRSKQLQHNIAFRARNVFGTFEKSTLGQQM